jgi:threonine dehydrogenase-like Zn-dependent dehydrogenase
MKAAVFHEPGHLTVEEKPVPVVGRDDVLVKVRAASICGTDLRILRNGHFKLPPGTPRVLGHEVAGQVVQVGTEVTTLAPGDRVSVTPNVGCGRCRWCRRGLNNMCPDYEAFGITIDGGFAEYLLVPGFALARGNAFALPEALSYEDAALVEPFSCCVRGQDALDVGVDDTVVVVGTGPIGLFHIMLAKLAGARRVIASNWTAPRLEAAKAAGADVLVEAQHEDLAAVVADVTDGRGADVVITCVSSPEVQSQAVDLLGTHGRANFFAGLGKGQRVPVDTNRLHYKGIRLTGTTGSSNADYERALGLAGDGRVSFRGVVSRTFGLDQIDAALEHAASGHGMKAMVVFDEEQGAAT